MSHKHIHIGFDAKRAAQNKTGLGNYSRFVIRGLAKWAPNLRLYLFTPNAKKTQAIGDIAKLTAVRMRFPESLFWRLCRALWRQWGVVRAGTSKKVRLFHGLTGELPWGLRAKGIKSVVTIHDLIFLRFPHYYPCIDRWIYHWKFRSACLRADRIIAVSECTKRDIIHFFGTPEEKISVVYQGCDEQFAQPVTEYHQDQVRRRYHLPERFILYVGSIEERKNLLLLAQALTQLPDEDITVIALGHQTAYAKKVRRYAEDHDLGRRFRMISGVNFGDLPVFYQLAQAFVYPSRFEGFGIPMLEAITSGTPAIGCTGSSLEEAGGPSCLYVSPDDPAALADALQRVLTDEDLRAKMIADGHAYAQRFDAEKLSMQLLQLYANII